jgi:hypothetical protein
MCRTKHVKCEYGMRLLWQDDADRAGIVLGRADPKHRLSRINGKSGMSNP